MRLPFYQVRDIGFQPVYPPYAIRQHQKAPEALYLN